MFDFVPKIAGYYLDIESIDDQRDNAIARHEFPYSKKNIIENIGLRTKSYNVKCVFQDHPALTDGWSPDDAIYPTFNSHKNFLETIEKERENITFVHPYLGEMEGAIESISAEYTDIINFVRVSFVFLQEEQDDTISFVRYPIPENAKNFRDSSSRMQNVLSVARKAAASAKKWERKMSVFRGKLQSKLSGVTSPIQSIANTISYGLDFPGLIMQDINGAIDRIVESFSQVFSSPTSAINSQIVEFKKLKETFFEEERQYIHVMSASRLGYETSVQLENDEKNRTETRTKESKPSFDANGNYRKQNITAEVMTIDDLDNITAGVKSYINEAVQLDRESQELLNMAKSIQDYVNFIKLEREIIITKTYNEQPLFCILQAENINYKVAERILKLNPDIIEPAFTSGDVRLIIRRQ